MFRIILNAKINNAIVTDKKLDYEGSIGIDKEILKKAKIYPNEKVQVLNYNNGIRFETYVIAEEKNSKKITLYGPAARLGEIGDKLCILSYKIINEKEISNHKPIIVKLKRNNKL
jgi:aspartate 1-decarboxylase